MTDPITIPRALLEQAFNVLTGFEQNYGSLWYSSYEPDQIDATCSALRAALAAPDDVAEEMSAVADQYAHKLALDLECVLADYSGTWYDTAIGTLGAYREAMNAIHERESPTFMGEPVLRDEPDKPADKPPTPAWHDAPETVALKAERDLARAQLEAEYRINSETLKILERTEQKLEAMLLRAELANPPTPAWHDAPTEPGLWMCNEGDDNPYRWTTHRVTFPLNQLLVGEDERWYGPIPPDEGKS